MSGVVTPANFGGRHNRPFRAGIRQANLFTPASTDCSRPTRKTSHEVTIRASRNGAMREMENEMLAEVLGHAEWIMFALVLANQAGVPVFAAPALLAGGALAWTGDGNVGGVGQGALGRWRWDGRCERRGRGHGCHGRVALCRPRVVHRRPVARPLGARGTRAPLPADARARARRHAALYR